MKFKDQELIEGKHGFEFVKDKGIMKGDNKMRCMHCGELTEFIEVCSEGKLCSDECVDAWYEMYNLACSHNPLEGELDND